MIPSPNERTNIRRLLGTSAGMFLAQCITILVGMALAILLARGMGAVDYGRYVFALTVAHMLSIPVQMGLPTLLMRQVAIYRSQMDWTHLRGIIRWSLLFVSLTFGVIGLIAAGYYTFWPDSQARLGDSFALYVLALMLVGVLGYMQVSAAILRGFERVLLGSLPDGVIRQCVFLTLVFVVSYFAILTPAWVMGLHMAAACGAVAWAAFMIARYCRIQPDDLALSELRFEHKSWLAALMPLSLAYGITLINGQIDIFMLGLLTKSAKSVGVYQVAMKVSSLAVVAQSIMYTIISPRIAKYYYAQDFRAIKEVVITTSRLVFVATLVFLLIFQIFGKDIFDTLFGQDFDSASQLTLIRCYGYLLVVILGPVTVLLNMTGHERDIALIAGVTACMNVFLNSLLIPAYGAEGAAVATTFAVFLSHAWMWLRVKQKVGMRVDIIGSSVHAR